jgi:hypothetical protein
MATVGKVFLTCSGIAFSGRALQLQTPSLYPQNNVPRSFRILTAVTEEPVTNAGEKLWQLPNEDRCSMS